MKLSYQILLTVINLLTIVNSLDTQVDLGVYSKTKENFYLKLTYPEVSGKKLSSQFKDCTSTSITGIESEFDQELNLKFKIKVYFLCNDQKIHVKPILARLSKDDLQKIVNGEQFVSLDMIVMMEHVVVEKEFEIEDWNEFLVFAGENVKGEESFSDEMLI